MPEPANTLLIEGSFEELTEELAQYLDHLKKPPSQDGNTVQAEVVRLLGDNQKDEALKKLVTASVSLNSAPEREFIQTYNLLIHLVRQSPNINMFLPRICGNLSQPITSSPMNGPPMALTILTTIFNILQSDNDVRYHVFLAIVSVVKNHGMYEVLRPQLKNLDRWIAEWESDEAEQQKLFLEIAMAAEDAGESEESYRYLTRALRILPPSESGSAQARKLGLRALKSALTNPSHFDFQDLTTLDAVQGLRKSDPNWFELLEIFNGKLLDDFDDFRDEHEDETDSDEEDEDEASNAANGTQKPRDQKTWFEQQGLDEGVLRRKMRLLTLASLAASSSSRSLPYGSIAKALQIPSADVEMWVIDVIRAGLVEGKLSQLNQTFLIHRATHRIFTEKQWRQVAARLDTWKTSLEGVLKILKTEREQVEQARPREARDFEGRFSGLGMGGASHGGPAAGGAGGSGPRKGGAGGAGGGAGAGATGVSTGGRGETGE